MDIGEFRDSVTRAEPPEGLSPALLALWWDAKGDWKKAHQCVQEDRAVTGSAVHAYLHRKEPDLANARHWYSRAGRTEATGPLDTEWEELAVELLPHR